MTGLDLVAAKREAVTALCRKYSVRRRNPLPRRTSSMIPHLFFLSSESDLPPSPGTGAAGKNRRQGKGAALFFCADVIYYFD